MKHLCCAPYPPSSNGAIEWLVQTVKQALKSGQSQRVPLQTSLATFLMQYRSTLHATTGVSPGSLFFSRPLRNRLDLLKPDIAARVCNKQADQKNYMIDIAEFAVGQTVMALNMREGSKWRPGVVVEQLGPLTYLVEVQGGFKWKRHSDHLCDGSGVPPALQVTNSDEDISDDTYYPSPQNSVSLSDD